jgi:hypothetical protein
MLTKSCHQDLLAKLRKELCGGNDGVYIFRRVKFVDMTRPKYTWANKDCPERDLNTLSLDEMKKNVAVSCDKFYGDTTIHQLRYEPHRIQGKCVRFSSETYKKNEEVFTPMQGDLLCIWLSTENIHGSQMPFIVADHWFSVSEQYLRAFTAILYQWHDTFDQLIPRNTPQDKREEALRKKLFCGNTLMVNGWLKHKQTLEQAKMTPMSKKESGDKFYVQRWKEGQHVDELAALVLLARFGEIPTELNIPNNVSGPKRTQWDLPEGFLERYEIELEVPPRPKVCIEFGIDVKKVGKDFRMKDILFEVDWY